MNSNPRPNAELPAGHICITENEDGITRDIELRLDMAKIFVDAMSLFSVKSKDYTNSNGAVFEDSGLIGQHLKLTDKVKKLRKTMWDSEIVREAQALGATVADDNPIALEFEGTEEILMDIIGHCALAISIVRRRELEERLAASEARSRIEEAISEGTIGVSEQTFIPGF